MSKFLIDENLSPLAAFHLKKCGYRAFAVRDLGLKGKSDESILVHAAKEGFVIVTGDVEFGSFFYERRGAVSIIVLRGRLQSTDMILKIIDALITRRIFATVPPTGYLILVQNNKVRVRKYIDEWK